MGASMADERFCHARNDQTGMRPRIDRELDLPLAYLLRMLIKPALVSVIGGLAAEPAAVLARQFMTRNDPLSGVGDGAALEEAQLLMYPSGGSQERIERGSRSPRATSKPAANGLPMPYAAHCESAR